MNAHLRILDERPMQTLVRLAVPNLAASLVQSLMIIVEGWYAGALGQTALAAVALVFPMFMATMMLSAGALGGAIAGAMARAMGAGDVARANAVLRVAILIALTIGMLKAALVLTFGPALFRAMGGSGAVLETALAYCWVLFPGIALIWVTNMITAALRGTGDMLRPACVTVLIVVTHFMLILGQRFAGAPFGLPGAGGAILGAYAVGLTYMVFVWRSKDSAVRLDLSGWTRLTDGWKILGAGSLAGSQTVMTIAYSLLATAVFGNLSAAWLAGYGIAMRLELLIVPVIFGIGGAGMVATGTLLGAGRRSDAVRMGWLSAFAAAGLVGLIGLVVSIWPGLWTGLFTDQPEIAETAAQTLRQMGPAYAFFALGLCLYFVSQGLATLPLPVLGAVLRLTLVAGAFWILARNDVLNAGTALWTVSGAMVFYGCFVALGLAVGPWRRKDV